MGGEFSRSLSHSLLLKSDVGPESTIMAMGCSISLMTMQSPISVSPLTPSPMASRRTSSGTLVQIASR
jgi:hypothetical protein